MAFSDAFLRGQAITDKAKDDKMAGVRAILSRSGGGRRGSAISISGGGQPLERVNAASRRVEDEENRALKTSMVEEQHQQNMEKGAIAMEASELANEETRRQLAALPGEDEIKKMRLEKETEKAYQNAIDAEHNVAGTSIAQTALTDTMDAQLRNRSRQSFSDYMTMGDVDGMNKVLPGMFPGMGGGGSVTRMDGDRQTGRGEVISAGEGRRAYPKFSKDDMGNITVQWPGTDYDVPFDEGNFRQLMLASSPMLETASGKPGTTKATATAPGTKTNTQADFLIKSQQANNDMYKTLIDFTNSMMGQGTGGELLTGGERKDFTPDQWLDNYKKGLKIMRTKHVEETLGIPKVATPMAQAQARHLAKGLSAQMEKSIRDGDLQASERPAQIKSILTLLESQHGKWAADMWMEENAAFGMPSNLSVKYDGGAKPDLGTGVDNVMVHMSEGEKGDVKKGFVIDTVLGHAKYLDVRNSQWRPMTKPMMDAQITQLKMQLEKVEGGPAGAKIQKMIKELEFIKSGFSEQDIMQEDQS